MLDFLIIATRPTKRGTIEIYPKFRTYPKSQDLMIRGGDFYAVWVEELGLWSTDEDDVSRMIDRELDKFAEENRGKFDANVKILYMWDSESGMIDSWHKFCQKQMRDSFHMLDENLIFSNSATNKKDYASKRLSYPLEKGSITAWDRLISTLYSPEERHKIEWAIGSIVSGESKTLQKFMVLYGSAGTGKSTILNIIQQLFEGYYCVFDAKALGSNGNQFALEAFRKNPLVAIQHDGNLSKIEDNTRLNSLVSHEEMQVNEKYTKGYTNNFKCFLFIGTNNPVKITDAKSGLMRRLIDVTPSGEKLSANEYRTVVKQVNFELGAIAYHCREVYLNNPEAYDDYTPIAMMSATNDFYNFMVDSFHVFYKEDGTTLKAAWEMYKTYCEEAKIDARPQRIFKEELKSYFREFTDRFNAEDGARVRSYYKGLKLEKFKPESRTKEETVKPSLIDFNCTESIFDVECADLPAQYANAESKPTSKWEKVKTTLADIDTSKVHYVKVPENHIVIDFDIKGDDGKKSFEKNVEEASKWPATYAELSKSGAGIHLHYIYTGDPSKLSRVYDDDIEIKVFTGLSSLRRCLSKCNDLPIATISSGLPLKEESKMVSSDVVQTEKGLRTTIKKCLNKEVHPGTKSNVDFIYKIVEDAYESGLHYDITDMRNAIYAFAANSTNNANYCLDLVDTIHFKSEEVSAPVEDNDKPIVFYDVEVFPNLFLVNYKLAGPDRPVVRLINPKPEDIEIMLGFRLVGFNCRRYDNHIMYARLMGYTNEQLYNLSQKIINNSPNCYFSEAYNLSYTDVYDFSAKKQSLKKWEIDLGIHHQELGLPWDQPVPEELWYKVAEYCDNDVIATEAVFNHLQADFTARKILADLAGGTSTVNDTTNTLTTRFIFGNDRKPQSQFNYRNLAEPVHNISEEMYEFLANVAPEMMSKTHGDAGSLLPYFPGYKYERGVSTYRGEEVGEGGYVYAEPGMYGNVALLDVASMHPHSIIMEVLFGIKFTKAFYDIVYGRVNIKHEAWDIVNNMLDGKLTPYIQKVLSGELTSDDLAYALKIAINSVYGLTAAGFDNPFKDPRNIDNIVAKRGALFMIDLKHEVQKRGYTVVHVKTDSIKIADATPEIIQFVMEFGKNYGYTFEHEATYDRMCLVNDAVYIAKYKDGKHAGEWTATGTQFQVPYVFKKLFSRESIEFDDLCEAKSVKSALYLDMNENLPDVSEWENIRDIRSKEPHQLLKREIRLMEETAHISDEELQSNIDVGHDYRFIGKVGNFCPIKPGYGGGMLMREQNGKYYAATGTKGYRWLESEVAKGNEDAIDHSYYIELVNKAVETISEYGDFEWFVSDDPYIPKQPTPGFMNIPDGYPNGIPFEEMPFN